ncbi:hypothetical protein HWA94_gp52 [Pseudomonas phage ZC08]|uniref:Uncharacterized protein n=1 Tax=Pseudomonas phage ZC08 TaxID=1622116 RepID=A0A1L2C9A6_9CAUD|nr:hypothetical protein HWA94_gp52 [Pseudomonas phage ZC08]AMD43491.1 hypothetical protein ZC08_074 [Pseudomonas phage ZC08]
MTDIELLELAAKAAGKTIDQKTFGEYQDAHRGMVVADGEHWNPLTDDGDALRLAVKLKLPITFLNRQTARCTPTNKYGIEPWVDCGSYWDSSDSMYYPFSEKCGDDPYAATRRAIVRAAAEVGRRMIEENKP